MNTRVQRLVGLLLAVALALPAVAVPLLQDPAFRQGVRVIPPVDRATPRPGTPSRCLPGPACEPLPAWTLQQWATAADIAAGEPLPVAGGSAWQLVDAAGRQQKYLVLAPAEPAGGDVQLALDGWSEFAARQGVDPPAYLPDLRRPWPHFLLSQQLASGRLSEYRALRLAGRFRLLAHERQQQPGYLPAVHAARLVLAITVRNRLTGNYFWLNLPLYDDRYAQTGFGCQKCDATAERCTTPHALDAPGIWRCPEDRVGDAWWENEKPGTARMIFRVATAAFLAPGSQQGDWVAVNIDLLPYVKAGIEAVRQRHNGHTFPADPFFYELGLFSVGWEITGLNRAAVQLQGWSLDGEPAGLR